MNHLALGASIPFAAAVVWYLLRRGRASPAFLIVVPALMVLTMTWAALPDIPRLLGMHRLYARLYVDPRCDLFLWHYSIDQVESGSTSIHAVLLIAMFGALIAAAWRQLVIEEKGI